MSGKVIRKKRSRSSTADNILNTHQKPSIDTIKTALYKYEHLVPGKLLKRYKRFLGDVSFSNGREEVVHVPNTGPMAGLLDNLPAPILCSTSNNPSRKYAHTLEWIQPVSSMTWVGVHSAKANAMALSLLESKALTNVFNNYRTIKKEVKYGKEGSRVDFVLDDGGENPPCFVEVKSVTLAEPKEAGRAAPGEMIALFPDTVSDRAQRHVRELTYIAKNGCSAALIFIIQRGDCSTFAPCHEKDPEYGRLVVEAAKEGVKIVAAVCDLDVERGCVEYKGQVPVDLEYKMALK